MTRAAIKHAEEQLREAMLAGDVQRLDALIDDDLLFLGPAGAVARKEEDLENHRSGRQRMTKIEPRDLVMKLHGHHLAVVTVAVELEGSFDGASFAGTFRYVRTWRRDGEHWRIIAGAVMPAAPAGS